ncbi:Fe(3+) ABC transporter substrate-binding protein [Roseospira visakhapatnamensis]|uniref:Iron(III) transport system substrate-binding protein n=1 Tax=Roseospira visakhapatnamensis TaxID=390880 RepID=A0A7W6RD73_9PROT|nr:Fe(3+) ABC transporter substrate-binding protein [Roseospira visakhapatnamensis]MBB4266409.1 iron(III) transport system substrate-binding protein [Roseospira visakhapatnamensis]
MCVRFPRLGRLALGLALLVGTLGLGVGPSRAGEEVNVYSTRQAFLIQPLFDAFTERTGIPVNVVFAKEGLIERLRAEGDNSPADLVFTADIGHLTDLVDLDVVQPVSNETLESAIPASFRHPDGKWFGLTLRGRVIYASNERVPPGAVTTYDDLADPRWKGRVCTRRGDHAYQVALLAAMIAEKGEAAARAWLEGVKANLARKPQGNDRAQVKAIKEGQCDLALGNTYYMGKMLEDPEQRAWAEAVTIVFPDQDGAGTHMNLSGVAMTRSAPNRAMAIRLLEFLVSDEAQQMYAEINHEYPIKARVPWSDLLRSWGTFRMDTVDMDAVARHRARALMMVNEVGYNN